ncbi:hypothetical protein V8E54_004794 [Elaphomyces granulatus]
MHFFKSLSLLACAFPMAFATKFTDYSIFNIWVQNTAQQDYSLSPAPSYTEISDGWAFVWYDDGANNYCNGSVYTWDPNEYDAVFWRYDPRDIPGDIPNLQDDKNNEIPQSGVQSCVYHCKNLGC